ncbi:hypothetical protein DPMN_070453 [Dreissena polymorpha]|uniref:Uncharacterized protein n=1 Tax=Dreissena polymorpha TaxID=45954 RepID=A0A9D3Z106_DREPO|nr:hypothetical protein DPMN_070453 [Dreissena polymorpha]
MVKSMSAPCWLKKVSPIYIPMSGQHRAVLHSRSRADIHTNVGPTSSRVALPISGRCNYRCRADIHTDVGPTLRRVALPLSGRCNYRCRADIEINIGPTSDRFKMFAGPGGVKRSV